MNPIRAAVSGSFRRHMDAVQHAVYELTDLGVTVLSPADPRVVDAFGDFVFVASDRLRAVKVVQSRHLAAIAAADLLWLVTPDGYVGPSAAMELGFAAAKGIPVLSLTPPLDLTMRQFVTTVPSIEAGLKRTQRASSLPKAPSALINPQAAVDEAQAHLERIGAVLLGSDATHTEDLPQLVESARVVRAAVRGM